MNDVLNMFNRHCNKMQKLSGGQYIALCPFHDDSKRSFSFNEEGLYNCKACGVTGNAIKFAKHFNENPKPFYSDDYLLNRFKNRRGTGGRTDGKQTGNADKQQDSSVKSSGKKPKLTIKQLWDKIFQYQKDWHDNHWRNVYMVGEHNGNLTFPYFDAKYPLGIKHHKKFWEGDGSLKFYMDWHIPHMEKTKPLFILEGEKDVLSLMELGYNCVCSSGGALSVPKIPQSFKQFNQIKIRFDNDEGGIKGANKMAQAIYEQVGTIATIGQWEKGVPNKYDVTDLLEDSK